MKDYSDLKFYNPSLGNISFKSLIKEIFSYVEKCPENKYEIIVGCDSSSSEKPHFPVAIVVLRKGQGGRFFLTKVRYSGNKKLSEFDLPKTKKFYNLHQRILEEVLLSCEIALELRDKVEEKVSDESKNINYEFNYIHADVGNNGGTKDMIREVTGLIKSRGFEPKIKPHSFAASVVADRFT